MVCLSSAFDGEFKSGEEANVEDIVGRLDSYVLVLAAVNGDGK